MSGTGSLHAVETVILLLLVLVAVFAAMARRLKVPYPIVLVLAGLVISFTPHIPNIPLEPNIVFVIFLAAVAVCVGMDDVVARVPTKCGGDRTAGGGVGGIYGLGVAEFSDRFITALDWKAGFLLGAVISTTDAIAATSIAKIDWAAEKDRRHS